MSMTKQKYDRTKEEFARKIGLGVLPKEIQEGQAVTGQFLSLGLRAFAAYLTELASDQRALVRELIESCAGGSAYDVGQKVYVDEATLPVVLDRVMATVNRESSMPIITLGETYSEDEVIEKQLAQYEYDPKLDKLRRIG